MSENAVSWNPSVGKGQYPEMLTAGFPAEAGETGKAFGSPSLFTDKNSLTKFSLADIKKPLLEFKNNAQQAFYGGDASSSAIL